MEKTYDDIVEEAMEKSYEQEIEELFGENAMREREQKMYKWEVLMEDGENTVIIEANDVMVHDHYLCFERDYIPYKVIRGWLALKLIEEE